MNRGYTITIIIVIIFQNTATETYLTLPTTNGEENNIYTDSAYITDDLQKRSTPYSVPNIVVPKLIP